MKKIIFLFLTVFYFDSCSVKKQNNFIKHCQTCRQEVKDKFCLISLNDVKSGLPKNESLYYLGSDKLFHYFKYATDKYLKSGCSFKIDKQTAVIAVEKAYNEKTNEQLSANDKVKLSILNR